MLLNKSGPQKTRCPKLRSFFLSHNPRLRVSFKAHTQNPCQVSNHQTNQDHGSMIKLENYRPDKAVHVFSRPPPKLSTRYSAWEKKEGKNTFSAIGISQ